uniref:Transmembrane protein 98 n=1 Tax=Hirondellea gigas TaxID=1518452 RepID=A0A2R5L346_9CRUS
MDPDHTVGAVALGVLAAIFVVSMVALAVICYRRHVLMKTPHHILTDSFYTSPELKLPKDAAAGGLELEDVRLAPQIDKILNDAQWVDDATGLIPHCLAILKLCHKLTERLVTTTLTPLPHYQINQIIQASRRVSPRLDDVARAMYPPLDPRLLEARCSSLTLILALLAAHTHPLTLTTQPSILQRDIADALMDMDRHLQVLRDAAQSHESLQEILAEGGTREPAD